MSVLERTKAATKSQCEGSTGLDSPCETTNILYKNQHVSEQPYALHLSFIIFFREEFLLLIVMAL